MTSPVAVSRCWPTSDNATEFCTFSLPLAVPKSRSKLNSSAVANAISTRNTFQWLTRIVLNDTCRVADRLCIGIFTLFFWRKKQLLSKECAQKANKMWGKMQFLLLSTLCVFSIYKYGESFIRISAGDDWSVRGGIRSIWCLSNPKTRTPVWGFCSLYVNHQNAIPN